VNEPTIAEALRRIESVMSRLTEALAEIRDIRAYSDRTYQRQDVARAQRDADHARVSELEKDVADGQRQRTIDLGFKRQVGLGIALALLSGLLGIIVSVVTFLVTR